MKSIVWTALLTAATLSSPVIAASAGGAVSTAALVAKYKFSALPVNYDHYVAWCEPIIRRGSGRPRTTDRCAPDFYPYVARPNSGDPLMDIIGKHDYTMNGHEYADGFSPPFEQKTAATFLVFPPMKNVVLVRVDDFDLVKNEERDIMSGVYLSIVGGKVVDQIYSCDFDRHYRCMSDGKLVATLGEDGRFRRR